MDKNEEVPATGTVIGRDDGRRGRLVAVAITLPENVWEGLSNRYAWHWQDAEDDLELRELTLDERIAVFVSDEADRWCDSDDIGLTGRDFDNQSF